MTQPVHLLYTDPYAPTSWDTLDKMTPIATLPSASEYVDTNTDNLSASFNAMSITHQANRWQDYKPQFIASFQWKNKYIKQTRDFLIQIYSNMIIPGTLRVYHRPEMPLTLSSSSAAADVNPLQPVTKPPFVAILMCVAKKDPALLSDSPRSVSLPLTFICHRHSLKNMLSDNDSQPWRVDVQRVGNVIYMRKYQNYKEENTEDIGHQFEAACCNIQQTAHDKLHYRSIMKGKVGPYNLVTSSEIDMMSSEIDMKSDQISSNTNTSTDADLSNRYLELKTAKEGSRQKRFKMKTYFIQSFLGGVPRVLFGYYSSDQPNVIKSIERVKTEDLIPDEDKTKVFNRLKQIFDFLANHVTSNSMYTLVLQKPDLHQDPEIALYRIDGGLDTFPIVPAGLLNSIKQVLEEAKKATRGSAETKTNDEAGSERDRWSESRFVFPFKCYSTKYLRCRDCGQTFEFSANEQAFFAKNGLSDRIRCEECKKKKNARGGRGRGGGAGRGRY